MGTSYHLRAVPSKAPEREMLYTAYETLCVAMAFSFQLQVLSKLLGVRDLILLISAPSHPHPKCPVRGGGEEVFILTPLSPCLVLLGTIILRWLNPCGAECFAWKVWLWGLEGE